MRNERTKKAFSEGEDKIILSGWGDQVPDYEILRRLIAAGFVRTKKSVACRRRMLGLLNDMSSRVTTFDQLPRNRKAGPKPNPFREQRKSKKRTVANDIAFKQSMLLAIKGGTESPIMGVVRDYRPIFLKTIHPEPQGSCIGSAAQQCADA
jgi:hypothetical protein